MVTRSLSNTRHVARCVFSIGALLVALSAAVHAQPYTMYDADSNMNCAPAPSCARLDCAFQFSFAAMLFLPLLLYPSRCFFFLFLCPARRSCQGSVRLPCTEFDANRVWHDLRTTGGCFAWSSTRPGVVTVTPLPDTTPGLQCPPGYSTAARVRVTAQSSCAVVRPDAWVTATPLLGGSSPMECHVRVGLGVFRRDARGSE